MNTAFCFDPQFLEHDTGLGHPERADRLNATIVHLRQQKQMSIILVEQYFDFAFGLADHIYAMTRGKIVYDCHKTKADKTQLRDSVGV